MSGKTVRNDGEVDGFLRHFEFLPNIPIYDICVDLSKKANLSVITYRQKRLEESDLSRRFQKPHKALILRPSEISTFPIFIILSLELSQACFICSIIFRFGRACARISILTPDPYG
uniref:Uncharacterized protein n=1 Tax=Glossina austeni TaxID=7395 RepID=A0A1A9UJH2_GLOAU